MNSRLFTLFQTALAIQWSRLRRTSCAILALAMLTPAALAQSPNVAEEPQTQAPKIESGSEATNQEVVAPEDNSESPQKSMGTAKLWRFRDAQQALIASEYSDHTVWLEAPINAENLQENADKFLAIWHQDYSGNPKGAVLILPDEDVPPTERTQLLSLLTYLSANGWSALSISLPPPMKTLPPARPKEAPKAPLEPATPPLSDSSENTPEEADINPDNLNEGGVKESELVFDDGGEVETLQAESAQVESAQAENVSGESASSASEILPKPVESIVVNRITSGINFLQQQSQFNNVIIAQGSSVPRALNFIAGLQSGDIQTAPPPSGIRMRFPLRALVIVDAEHTLKELPELDLLGIIGGLEIPILDIYRKSHYQTDSSNREKLAFERQKVAKREKLPVYVNRAIQATPVGQKGEPRQTRIIRGFLHRHAQGVEDEQPNN